MTLVNESTIDITRISVCDDWTLRRDETRREEPKWTEDGKRGELGTNGDRIGARMENQRTDKMAGEPMRTDDKTKEFRRNLVR